MGKIILAITVWILSLYSLGKADYTQATEPLVIYNWLDYLPSQAIETFSSETGIQVDYRTYTSNEEMYETLINDKYSNIDLIVPSTYMINKMQREGLLQAIDFTQLSNLQNLAPNLLNRSYDSGNKFSIPYLWGSLGIAINGDFIDASKIRSWQDLWQDDWLQRLVIQDDMRSFFQIALNAKGYSPNTRDLMQIKSAYKQLYQLLPNVALFSAESSAKALLESQTPIGVVWNGDAFVAQQSNPAITYVYPSEGTTFWIDSFAIPIHAQQVEYAHRFIDFMLRPEIAAKAVEELGYATPNAAALAFLEEDLRTNPIIFPPESVIVHGSFEKDQGEQATARMQHYWQALKNSHTKNSDKSTTQGR